MEWGTKMMAKCWMTFPVTYTSLIFIEFQADLSVLEEVKVVYKVLPGWMCDISDCRSFDQLPSNAKNYVQYIEKSLGVPVSYIGVGPSRDAMIKKSIEQ